MGLDGATSEAVRERREVDKLNRLLKKTGIHCGVPLIHNGDEFELAKFGQAKTNAHLEQYLDMMQRVQETPAAEDIPVTTHNEDVDAALARIKKKLIEESATVVRNSWFMKTGYGTQERHFEISIIEVNPEAPERERRVRLKKQRIQTLIHVRYEHMMQTVRMSPRISLIAERRALRKLRTLIEPGAYEIYLLSGALGVTGKSGLNYVLRKQRPTIAIRPDRENPNVGDILCALCFHPLGYYTGSWAGALPPTDEVIAHLLLIRGDEHLFWKRANQIPIHQPNSGI